MAEPWTRPVIVHPSPSVGLSEESPSMKSIHAHPPVSVEDRLRALETRLAAIEPAVAPLMPGTTGTAHQREAVASEESPRVEPILIAPGIEILEGVRFGRPVIAGTNIEPVDVWSRWAAGGRVEDMARDLNITIGAVLDAIVFWAGHKYERPPVEREGIERLAPDISKAEGIHGGAPGIASQPRLSTRTLWAFYEDGVSLEKIGRDYPSASPVEIRCAIAFEAGLREGRAEGGASGLSADVSQWLRNEMRGQAIQWKETLLARCDAAAVELAHKNIARSQAVIAHLEALASRPDEEPDEEDEDDDDEPPAAEMVIVGHQTHGKPPYCATFTVWHPERRVYRADDAPSIAAALRGLAEQVEPGAEPPGSDLQREKERADRAESELTELRARILLLDPDHWHSSRPVIEALRKLAQPAEADATAGRADQ